MVPTRSLAIADDAQQQLEAAGCGSFRFSISDAQDLADLPQEHYEGFDPHRIQVVGNLPFGIASILLLNLLRMVSTPGESPLGRLLYGAPNVEMLLMFQKEVAKVDGGQGGVHL